MYVTLFASADSLCNHGMCDDMLRYIFRPVMFVKLLYTSPAWWWYATIGDKQCIEEFVFWGIWLSLYGTDDPTPVQLAEDADESLFRIMRYSKRHILQQFLLVSTIAAIVFGLQGITLF